MGVLSCGRPDCERIMCDTYVPSVGYVCTDCQQEFINYFQQAGLENPTEGEITEVLKLFMTTPKGRYGSKKMTVEYFFKTHTNIDWR